MRIIKTSINNFRNLNKVEIHFNPDINFIGLHEIKNSAESF